MASKSAAGKKKKASKRPAASQRGKSQRPGSSARSPKSKAGPSRVAALLPFFSIWLVAAVVLGGLIYWGNIEQPSPVQQPVVEDARTKNGPKPFGNIHKEASREVQKAGETRRVKEQQVRAVEPAGPKPSVEVPPPPRQSVAANRPALHEEKKLASLQPGRPKVVPPREAKPVAPLGEVAIVIDDFGLNLEMAKRFLTIPLAITFSVLPFQTHSEEIARLAGSHGHEVILHLPMEPQQYPRINPGTGALLVSMSPESIQRAVRTALDACPNVSGVNNHMGSRFTQNPASMRVVLSELQRRGLYFLDSFTTDKSVGYSLARQLNLPSIRRDIFLDHTPTERFVRGQIVQLIRRAKIQGSAVAIGHPYKSTYKVLAEEAGRFKKEGIAVVYSGRLIQHPAVSRAGGD